MTNHEMVQVGSMIAGKYRVDRVLGQGGMGIVVLATHVQLHRPVAIKFILPEVVGTPHVVQRFLREAQAAVQLSSEHVARVLDVGALETGAPYMVLEYLEGADLASFPRSQLTVGGIVDLVLQACEALAEAHALGIVHRDIKPANFYITRRADGTPLLKVLDFGISKTSVTNGPLTVSQAVMGTPAYMSPEQMRSSRDVDHRSDIWSLGAVLYELLQGAPPFRGDTFSSMVLKVVNEPLPKLTVRLPGELDEVVYRCLEKDPAKRFQNIAELTQAIAKYAHSATQAAISVQRTRGVAGSAVPRSAFEASPARDALPSTLSGSAGVSASPGHRGRRWPLVVATGVVAAAVVMVLATVGGRKTAGPLPGTQPTSTPETASETARSAAIPNVQPLPPTTGSASPTITTVPPAPDLVPPPAPASVAPAPGPATPLQTVPAPDQDAVAPPAQAAPSRAGSATPIPPAATRAPASAPAVSKKANHPPSAVPAKPGDRPARPRTPAADDILKRRR
jgi:serine/threonine protein kinase